MRPKVTFINLYIDKYKLSNMCAVLEITPRTYYIYKDAEDKNYYDYLIIKEIFDDSPMESFHSILKKETLYNNDITSLQEYIELVENWIKFYTTKRLKNKRKK